MISDIGLFFWATL